MQTPLVTIITVNYEHSDVTCELLQSLSKIQYRNIEIIVVDNASEKDHHATKGVVVKAVPGAHSDLFAPPNDVHFAKLLNDRLDEIEGH